MKQDSPSGHSGLFAVKNVHLVKAKESGRVRILLRKLVMGHRAKISPVMLDHVLVRTQDLNFFVDTS